MYRDCDIPAPVYGDWSEGEDVPYAFRLMREKQSFDLVPPEVIRAARDAYYGVITQIDYNMGRIFAALQDTGIFDDTFIIYTSDHGEHLGDHHAGGKGFFHEPSAHVPFALRMPQGWDNRQHGTRNQSLGSLPQELRNLAGAAEASPHLERLRNELIARHQARGSEAVEEGNWVTLPVPPESETDRHNTSWPGYHTEYYHIDVRH